MKNNYFKALSLGQHFLTSEKALFDIISASEIIQGEHVLEIGPGKGVLTKELLKAGAKVTAVEKDSELIPSLQETFKNEIAEGMFILIEGDILLIDVKNIFKNNEAKYKVVANIPYYITGQLFRLFLESEYQPSLMTVLVQKEVAERVVAKNKKESILSLSVKAYGEVKYISTVKRGSFSPPPNVDSAILLIKNISKDFFTSNNIMEKTFFDLVKTSFAHKRKKIESNLKLLSINSTVKVKNVCEVCGVPPNARAEDLSLEHFACLSKQFSSDLS